MNLREEAQRPSPCVSVTITKEEEALYLSHSGRKAVLNSSRCDACNRVMSKKDMARKNPFTGEEYGLCGRCLVGEDSGENDDT